MMKQFLVMLIGLALLGTGMTACSTASNEEGNAEATTTSEADVNVNQAPEAQAVAVNNEADQLTGYQVGDKATDFKLMGTDDKEHSLGDMADVKGYVITFTCNHCPYSVLYEDRLIDFHNAYAAKGYPVIAINPNDPGVQPEDSFELMKERAKEKSFPFLYLFDEGQAIYPQYGATRTPHVFLLDKDMVVRYIGAIDNNAREASAVTEKYLEKAIKALEAGQQPDPNFTKAVGCTIKAKKS